MKDLKDAIEKGTKAWADVPDASAWVEELRGNRSQTKGEEHMTERQIVNWLLGFVIGILTVLAWQRVMSDPLIHPDSEMTRAEELISVYKRGAKDALSTNPVNFELEQACLEVWANKQPVEAK